MSAVRVHVERVIGSVRQKYELLQQEKFPLPMLITEKQEVAHIDVIVTVCCALVNLRPSIVEPIPAAESHLLFK